MAISGSNDCDELNRGIGNAVAHGDYVLAALRRIKRFERFVEHQRHRREWLNFREIADWLARRENAVVPDKVVRSGAYDLLRDDLLAGDFEEGGKIKGSLSAPPQRRGPDDTAAVACRYRGAHNRLGP